ncbi:MAG TPA: hypothetical protein VFH43_02250, partial [Candidatus Kapabacteria bacterium]|nr:hypothetical protein [Candidatus Kapabacteria bacterium]
MTLARRFAALLTSTLFCFLMLPGGSARAQMELAIIDSNPKLFPVGDVDSMDVRVAVWNMTSSPVRAIARVTSHSQNYSYVLLTSDSVTLPVSQVQFFDVRFYNHQSDGRGSATFEVSSAHAYDSITISAYPGDTALFPGGGPKIRNNLRAIWDVVPGTKVCQTNAIQNTNQKDMIITSITSTNPRFVIENVTLPLTIPGGQHQREIDICYAPESSAPSGFRDETKIVFEYIDQQGNVKSSNVSYVATTVSCLMPESDTLLVEPTILGGFVDVKAKLYNMSGSS